MAISYTAQRNHDALFPDHRSTLNAYFAQGRPSIHGMPVHGFTPCRSSAREAGRVELSMKDEHSSMSGFFGLIQNYAAAYKAPGAAIDGRPGSSGTPGFGIFRPHGFELTDRLAAQVQVIGVVNDAVQDGVGQSWIIEVGMPLLDLELAGDDGGGLVVAIIEDFQQIPFALIRERPDREVVDQEQVRFGECAQEGRAALEGVGTGQFIDQPRQTEATDMVSSRDRRRGRAPHR